MRKRLIILLVSVYFPFFIHAQYSNYYNVETNNKHDLRGEVNINQNINVRGRVNTTIETIDYGALANANAQNEANRIQQLRLQIEQKQYQDQREKQLAIIENNRELEITQNPFKALKYGENFKQKVECRDYFGGIKRYEVDATWPHKSLFKLLPGSGIILQNVGTNGIITEIIYEPPFYTIQKTEFGNEAYSEVEIKRLINLSSYYQNTEKPKRKDFQNRELYLKAKGYYISICDSLDNIIVRKVPINKEQKNDDLRVGEKFPNSTGDSSFLHKKEIVRRRIAGHEGYCGTIIWEDDYELCITDNYRARDESGVEYLWKVRYKCDKNGKTGFEDLEGRRYYLRGVIDQFIATWSFSKIEKCAIDNDYPKRRDHNNSTEYLNALKKWFEKRKKL